MENLCNNCCWHKPKKVDQIHVEWIPNHLNRYKKATYMGSNFCSKANVFLSGTITKCSEFQNKKIT